MTLYIVPAIFLGVLVLSLLRRKDAYAAFVKGGHEVIVHCSKDIEKAEKVLGWTPTYTADVAIARTVDWYKHFYAQDTDMYKYTIEQIQEYEESIKWNKNYVIK